MNKFLDAAMKETDLPDVIFRGLVGICLTCPPDGVHKAPEAWADIYIGRPMAFPTNGLFLLRDACIIEVGFGSQWVAMLKVSRGRLRSPKRNARPGIPANVRREVFSRDGSSCAYCETKSGPFDIDHVLPWSRGGTNDLLNLVVACASCNRSKSDRTPEEWLG